MRLGKDNGNHYRVGGFICDKKSCSFISAKITSLMNSYDGSCFINMYYLKNEQECFIRFKATSAQREWL
jgi:hypothetical protein